MQHANQVPYEGGPAKLAEDLGNLRYDALAAFLVLLAAKIDLDGDADLGRNRHQLATELKAAADHITQAWKICKPFMSSSDSPPP
jgi:hypothetical protein